MRRFPWLAVAVPLVLMSAVLLTSVGAQTCPFCGLDRYAQLVPIVVQPLAPTATPIPPTPTTAPLAPGVRNGGFEAGGAEWISLRNGLLVDDIIGTTFPGTVRPHGGAQAAWLGGRHSITEGLAQRVAIPAGTAYFVYWYWIASADVCLEDILAVGLVNDDGTVTDDEVVTGSYLCSGTNTGGWRRASINVSRFAGQTRRLLITVGTDSSLNSNAFVDDVALQRNAAASTSVAEDEPDPVAAAPRAGPAFSEGASDPQAAQLLDLVRQQLAR
jgi:hypothetical protein